ncbi:MAG TPA: nuclear transport factor 2 family protein [Acidobacteriaceae bacterium]|jgi:ketosteroid isomerase-like protein|nr:nuclear transport factor 2 family protein [Acidobacteriaceae bacterium]
MNRSSRLFLCSTLLLAFAPSVLFGQSVAATSVSYNPAYDANPTAMSQEIIEMQKIADLWDDAVKQRDQYGLELVLSPKLIDISSTGQVTNRDEQVAEIVEKNSPILSLDQKVASVRMMGDVAIVNGTYDVKLHSNTARKQENEEKGVYSQVFEHTRNSWICINSQRTTLVQQPVRPGDKKKEAASNDKSLSNGLPFSFLGFHHKDTDQ